MTATNDTQLQAPFPWFGGKSRVAHLVWERFDKIENYVEPFFGSEAVLLRRPDFDPDNPFTETVNDKDGYVTNFWRAIQHAPDEVAHWADYPAFENDLHARHVWLVNQKDDLVARLEGDPDYYDAKIAGWWVWGINLWIGAGWCFGEGSWRVVDGRLVKADLGNGVHRQLMHLSHAGQGVHRQPRQGGIQQWFEALSIRLRRVRVASGDWARVVQPAVLQAMLPCGIFLDPPYGVKANRASKLYREDSLELADDVRAWALEHGHNPAYRIALCGYVDEHAEEMEAAGWTMVRWRANGGYSNLNQQGNDNKHREAIWFSPYCLNPHDQNKGLFDV